MKAINARAKKVHGRDGRTMDQIRADLYLDILETATIGLSNRGVVDIRVDLASLAKIAEAPGDLGGYGPVTADIARQVTERQHGSEWRWTLTDPKTGQPIDTGTTNRRPNTSQRRRIQARNRTCIHPGCRMPATECDIDHTKRWVDGGPTAESNLAPVCRHHHVIRHRHGWVYQALENGDHLFTSPLGHAYTTSGRPP